MEGGTTVHYYHRRRRRRPDLVRENGNAVYCTPRGPTESRRGYSRELEPMALLLLLLLLLLFIVLLYSIILVK